jgi:hypothetical protein
MAVTITGSVALSGSTSLDPAILPVVATAGTTTSVAGVLYTALSFSPFASVANGNPPYIYSIQSGTLPPGLTINSVGVVSGTPTTVQAAANVVFAVTDTLGNPASTTVTISFTVLNMSAVAGATTTVNAVQNIAITSFSPFSSVTGGTAPYTGTGVFSAVAGARTYTVRDAAGSTQSTSITITQPTDIILAVSVASDISIIGGTTSVAASATGGIGSYRYSLDAGPSQTGSTFRSVGAGTHFITVVDLNGCSKMKTFTVNQVSSTGMALTLISKTEVTCKGGKDGTIEVKASGGREPFQYAIGTGNYQINNRFYGLRPGTYRVYAKDANNNIVNIVVVILDGKRPCTFGKTAVNINTYPNPSTTSFKLSVDATSDEEVIIEVMDLYGRKLYQEKGGADKTYNFGQYFKAGIYFVRVTQGQVQTTQKIIKQ